MYEKKRAGKGAPFKALKEVPSVRLENAVATFRILQVGNAKLQQIPMCLLDSNDLHLLLPLLTNRIVLVARKRGRARYWSNQAANTNGVPAATKRLKKKKKKRLPGFLTGLAIPGFSCHGLSHSAAFFFLFRHPRSSLSIRHVAYTWRILPIIFIWHGRKFVAGIALISHVNGAVPAQRRRKGPAE